MLEMEVHGVNLDVLTEQPVIILKDVQAKRFLPIWIGKFEATAILMEMQGVKPSRPVTHDLLKSVIDSLEGTVSRIVITDLKEQTYYAQIHLQKNGAPLTLDSRPSDAIALAVRVKVPIFAAKNVLEKATVFGAHEEETEVERFRDFLANIEPEDFKED